MSDALVHAYECDGCGAQALTPLPRTWKTTYYGGTSVRMHFCPNCLRLAPRLSKGNPYDTNADAIRRIETLRLRRSA